MAVTPRSFLRNPLLLILLVGFSVAAYGMWSCPTKSSCSYSKTKQTANVDTVKAQQAAKQVQQKAAEASTQKGWLGVQIRTLRPNIAKALGTNPNLKGVHVMGLQQGKPAQYAGFQRNDIITHFDGKRVTTSCQLKQNVLATTPGKRVQVRVVRDGKALTLFPQLTEAPEKSCGGK